MTSLHCLMSVWRQTNVKISRGLALTGLAEGAFCQLTVCYGVIQSWGWCYSIMYWYNGLYVSLEDWYYIYNILIVTYNSSKAILWFLTSILYTLSVNIMEYMWSGSFSWLWCAVLFCFSEPDMKLTSTMTQMSGGLSALSCLSVSIWGNSLSVYDVTCLLKGTILESDSYCMDDQSTMLKS